MSPRREPKNAVPPPDVESDATDGGWDPYVASLLGAEGLPAAAGAHDEDDGEPVMSFASTGWRHGR